MKSHSNYFQNVFIPNGDLSKNRSKEIFEDIKKEYQRQTSKNLLQERSKSTGKAKNKSPMRKQSDYFEDIFAETDSLGSEKSEK